GKAETYQKLSSTGYYSISFLYPWVEVLRGEKEPAPLAKISLKTMLIMEGIYMSNELGKEISAEEVKKKSKSTSLEP
ncbi:hypothetical protein AKJ63_00760, partial [candidate division MSBL1 archaeon SCGC-AAA259D18]